MNWHVTDQNPTHHISICAETTRVNLIASEPNWYHVCGKFADHGDVHECGECGVWWL